MDECAICGKFGKRRFIPGERYELYICDGCWNVLASMGYRFWKMSGLVEELKRRWISEER